MPLNKYEHADALGFTHAQWAVIMVEGTEKSERERGEILWLLATQGPAKNAIISPRDRGYAGVEHDVDSY